MIRVDNLVVTIRRAEILSGVAFEAPPGVVVGLIGPNGSGKTTTLRCIFGALRPRRGGVLIDGRDTRDYSPRERARVVATVPQGEQVQAGTVLDAVLLGCSAGMRSWQRYGTGEHGRAERAMAETGVDHLRNRQVAELSGGERQRVMIARALAQGAPHLLLDEPTNHLDVRYQHEVLDLVRQLGLSTVVVLHDLALAARYCERLVLLDHGRVAAEGTPGQILAPEVLEPVYRISARRLDDEGVPLIAFRKRSAS